MMIVTIPVNSEVLGPVGDWMVAKLIRGSLQANGYEQNALPDNCSVTLQVLVKHDDGPIPKAPTAVYGKDAELKGRVIQGRTDSCVIEDCKGIALCVEWPDGSTTWPCTAGMFIREDGQWQIEK